MLSNCIFIGFFDNWCRRPNSHITLWIAFKLYIYRVLWQPHSLKPQTTSSCELLSNCIFIGFFDNRAKLLPRGYAVVNCFQIVYLSGSLTTAKQNILRHFLLWIAFKLYIYRVLWQLLSSRPAEACGCELLSNCIFIGFFDNANWNTNKLIFVVNCFQIVYLSGSLTTL